MTRTRDQKLVTSWLLTLPGQSVSLQQETEQKAEWKPLDHHDHRKYWIGSCHHRQRSVSSCLIYIVHSRRTLLRTSNNIHSTNTNWVWILWSVSLFIQRTLSNCAVFFTMYSVVSSQTPTSRSSDRQLVRAGCNRVASRIRIATTTMCVEECFGGTVWITMYGEYGEYWRILADAITRGCCTLKHCLLMGHVNSHYGVHTELIWGTVLCTLSTFKQPVRIHDFQPWSVKLTIPPGISLLVT